MKLPRTGTDELHLLHANQDGIPSAYYLYGSRCTDRFRSDAPQSPPFYFGAAAQLGIFAVLLVAILMGFTPKEAASLGIIGGADGPTAIFTTIKLAPHLLGPIAIAAYSYMALVPVIIPLVVRLWCTKKELSINMKEQEKKYPSTTEIKNLRVLKILFPIVVTTIVALFVPSAVPLIGMLMFGNLVKEIGSNTSRLF